MKSIILYKFDASPPSRAAMMILDILGLDSEVRNVSLPTRENYEEEFMERNPMHTVPLLQDGDFYLADSHAIATYLVSKYGEEKKEELYPEELKKRAIIDQRLHFDNSVFFPQIKSFTIDAAKHGAIGPSDRQVKEVEEAYKILERYLDKSAFVAGDNFTVADVCLVVSISSLDALIPVKSDKFTKITGWFEDLKAKSWYRNCNVKGLYEYKGFITRLWEYNRRNK